jgi:hypothetical protein
VKTGLLAVPLHKPGNWLTFTPSVAFTPAVTLMIARVCDGLPMLTTLAAPSSRLPAPSATLFTPADTVFCPMATEPLATAFALEPIATPPE